jgi:DNA-binding CsgD family transcriptional regulator
MIALELSSKDIAAILCVEVSSVEVYRYRIRKKLHVASKDALHAVLVDI